MPGIGIGISLSFARGGAAAWSLSRLRPGVLVWAHELRSVAAVNNVDDGDGIDVWYDTASPEPDTLTSVGGSKPTYRAARLGGRACLTSEGSGFVRGAVDRSVTHVLALGWYKRASAATFADYNGLVTLNNVAGTILSGETSGYFSSYAAPTAYLRDGVSVDTAAAAPGLERVVHLFEMAGSWSGAPLAVLVDRFVDARTWPGGILATVGLSNPSAGELAALRAYLRWYQRGAKVITCGDSITAGVGAVTPPLSWPSLLHDAWHGTVDVVNLAVSGQGVGTFGGSATSSMIDGDPIALADPALALGDPSQQVVVCAGGSNDLALGRTLQQTKDSLVAYVAARQAEGRRVVVCTVLDRQDRGGGQAAFDTARQALNAWIVAGGTGADAVVDLRTVPELSDVGAALDATYFRADDTTHPTVLGTSLIAPAVRSVLEALLAA